MILSNTSLDWYDASNKSNCRTRGYLLGWSDSGYAQTTNTW